MVKCFYGACSWKDKDGLCNAPCPGNMSRKCNSTSFDELPEVEKLALLLQDSPGLTVGECEFQNFLDEASWLVSHGVHVMSIVD